MPRIHLDFPDTVHFRTAIPVRITDINYGGHLGNDSVLSLLHEARVQWLAQLGYTELNIEGIGIIMADVAIQYRAETHYGAMLEVEISVGTFERCSFDLFYRLINQATGQEVARAKTHLVFFDYEKRKMRAVPEKFVNSLVR